MGLNIDILLLLQFYRLLKLKKFANDKIPKNKM